MRVLWSTYRNVFVNLAAEEWWLDHFEALGPALIFCVNKPAIVVGKNQIPWQEANTAWAQKEEVPLARRVSGGGTVWHDEGNLNFSLILPRAAYSSEKVFRQTLDALRTLGVEATLANGNSLHVGGKKISGTAFCYRGNAVLHHATLLIRSDLDRLRDAMRPSLIGLETRAIASRPAPVMNLTDVLPSTSLEDAARALARSLAGTDTWETYDPLAPKNADFELLVRRRMHFSWVYGLSPSFSWQPDPSGPRLIVERSIVTRLEIGNAVVLPWHPIPFKRDQVIHQIESIDAGWASAFRTFDW